MNHFSTKEEGDNRELLCQFHIKVTHLLIYQWQKIQKKDSCNTSHKTRNEYEIHTSKNKNFST